MKYSKEEELKVGEIYRLISPNLQWAWIIKVSERSGNPDFGIYDCPDPYFNVSPSFSPKFKNCETVSAEPHFEDATELEKYWLEDCIIKGLNNTHISKPKESEIVNIYSIF